MASPIVTAYCTGGNGTQDAALRMFRELYPHHFVIQVHSRPTGGNPYRFLIKGVAYPHHPDTTECSCGYRSLSEARDG